MFLTQINNDDIKDLTVEERTKIVFDTIDSDSTAKTVIGIVLGCSYVPHMDERIIGAYELYKSGKVEKLILSGTVIKDLLSEKRITEAEYMAERLIQLGVREDDLILENNARSTIENFLFAQIEIDRHYGSGTTFDVYIVTCPLHARRSKLIADVYMPKNIKKYLYPCRSERHARDNWMNTSESILLVNEEIRMMRNMALTGLSEDIEF